MTKTDNELIAEFMGFPAWEEGMEFSPPHEKFKRLRRMNYHDSWDWLIPVVHKILKTYEPPSGQVWPYCYIQLETTRIGNSIEYVYQRVLEFIKWHSEQTK